MTKRVYRYFFDFLDGQEEWLNQMAEQGWRLVKCRQLTYEFEKCESGEYEYAVEFMAHKSFSDSKKYKEFLESIGYKTLYKNLNVGIAVGKVKWRPWAEGAGQIVTSPGGYFKELLIVERKKDDKPFELHTDLTDKLSLYRSILNACLWAVCGFMMLVVMCLSFALGSLVLGVFTSAIVCFIMAIPCTLFMFLLLKPLRGVYKKVRVWEEKAKTNEYDAPKRSKRIPGIIAYAVFLLMFGITMFLIMSGNIGTINNGSVIMLVSDNGRTHWNAEYMKFNGFRQRKITLGEGTHIFTVEIVTDSGEVSFSIKGKDGTDYYNASAIPTSTFHVIVEGSDRVTLRIDGKSHKGSYKVSWEE